MDKDVLYTTELHIYLDERDNRTPDMKAAISDGFVDESCLLDFPVRDKKTVLHVRRRRWTNIMHTRYMKNGISAIPCNCALNPFIFELNDSADAFVDLFSK